MTGKYKFQKNYFIFNLEDIGYGVGQEPTGYIRIEIRDGKGKLLISIQNIKMESDYFYEICAFGFNEEDAIKADIGRVSAVNNNIEFRREFDPSNLCDTGKSIDEFSVFALLVQLNNQKADKKRIICPLAAYRNKKIEWRSRLKQKAPSVEIAVQKEKEGSTREDVEKDRIEYKQEEQEEQEETQAQEKQVEELTVTTLVEYFDKYFEKADPFNSRRRDYRWWEVSTPEYLKNILYQFNIKTSEIFDPTVMMAHFKYRHLIIGIYTDRIRGKEYIVCGIPGIYNVDERPLGGICRWVQLKGSRPKEGAFGYWLVYIESENGEFLNFN